MTELLKVWLIKYLINVLLASALFVFPSGIALAPIAQAQEVTSTPVVIPAPSYLSNCYAYVRHLIPSFPMASEVVPNTTPHLRAVAIFNYNGIPHYGIITKITDDGFWLNDSNYGGPGIRTHFISWSDKYLVGFWAGGDTS